MLPVSIMRSSQDRFRQPQSADGVSLCCSLPSQTHLLTSLLLSIMRSSHQRCQPPHSSD
ncbi:hypothetical protein STEG23_002111, partial [Scotinomys teguina]